MFKKLTSISVIVMFVLTFLMAGSSNSSVYAASKADQVTIKYVSWMSKGEDKPILEAFMKANPNIKVEDEVFDGTQYDKLMKIRLLAGDAPDVFLFQAAQYKPYVKEGYLMDLTNQPGTVILTKTPSVADFYKVNGKIYGNIINGDIPIPAVYYNKKYFSKLGIKPPTTVNEFLAICKKIKADGKDPLVFGGKDRWPVDYFLRSKAFSGMLKTNLEWQLALNKGTLKPSQFYKGELTFINDLVQKGYIGKPSLTLSYDQSVQYFADGKAAMLPQGTWIPSLEVIKNAKSLELGSFALPTPDKYAMAEVDRSIAVSASTKHPAEAQKLYNFFMDTKNLKTYLEGQSLTTLLNIDYKVDPVLKDYVKNLYDPKKHTAVLSQKTIITPAFTDATWNAYVNIMAGSTVSNELKKLDTEFAKTKANMIISGN
jgi:raffinose/stachyose/melibiose transport system substrate-binding protein